MRAARAWALGGDCSMCPRLPAYPAQCSEDEPIQWNVYDTEETSDPVCPVFRSIEYQRVIHGYALFDKGQLPDPGGWLQQGNWWLEAFEVIDAQVQQVRREQADKDKPEEH